MFNKKLKVMETDIIKPIIFLSISSFLIASCAPDEQTTELGYVNTKDTTLWSISNRTIPPPKGASNIFYKAIKSTLKPDPVPVMSTPDNAEAWKVFQKKRDSINALTALDLASSTQVRIEEMSINGVTVRQVIPIEVDEAFSKTLFIHLHGGAYTFNTGMAGLIEAIVLSNRLQIRVLSIDYRMPPEHPFPAAQDDAVTVYKKVLEDYPDYNLFLGGTSAGGGLTMSTVLRLKKENIKLPSALFAGTPWTDLTKTGDSYFINDGIDRFLVLYEGVLEESALLYAGDNDLKHPYISPIYGDLSGFPPTFLLTGTRDLFLSNTVRAHRKLRDAGVVTDLVVLEGVSHGDYLIVLDAPESVASFLDLKHFLKNNLNNDFK
jgi:acetyl esterase/lipase